jgi:hypothetical protein
MTGSGICSTKEQYKFYLKLMECWNNGILEYWYKGGILSTFIQDEIHNERNL